jgi:hypothetical protein
MRRNIIRKKGIDSWLHTEKLFYIFSYFALSNTYDHRVWRTGLPVRSAVLKPDTKRSKCSESLASCDILASCIRVSAGDMGENYGDWG